LAGDYKPRPFYTARSLTMEREILKYELEYTLEDGEQGFIPIQVDLITHEMRNLMWDIIKEQYTVQELVTRIEAIKSEVALVLQKPAMIDQSAPDKDEQLTAIGKEIEGYSDQIRKINKTIESYSDGTFFRKRFEVVKQIFKRNRITDERLLSFDFWEKNTDEKAIIEVLNLFYFKDIKKNNPINSETSSAMN
jgi:hypothetical protein